jgi:hypothetical protein
MGVSGQRHAPAALAKNVEAEYTELYICPLFFYGCETWSVTLLYQFDKVELNHGYTQECCTVQSGWNWTAFERSLFKVYLTTLSQ